MIKVKHILLPIITVFIIAALIIFSSLNKNPDVQIDIVKVNDIIKTLSDNWENIQSGIGIPVFEYGLDYVVIDKNGELIFATNSGLSENINNAISNRDTIIDITVNDDVAGKVIFYNDTAQILENNNKQLIISLICIFIIMSLIYGGYIFYLYQFILRPFKKMQGFAQRIAAGNLDIPLEMDKDNVLRLLIDTSEVTFDVSAVESEKVR